LSISFLSWVEARKRQDACPTSITDSGGKKQSN
jgi:hypothetical protein